MFFFWLATRHSVVVFCFVFCFLSLDKFKKAYKVKGERESQWTVTQRKSIKEAAGEKFLKQIFDWHLQLQVMKKKKEKTFWLFVLAEWSALCYLSSLQKNHK